MTVIKDTYLVWRGTGWHRFVCRKLQLSSGRHIWMQHCMSSVLLRSVVL